MKNLLSVLSAGPAVAQVPPPGPALAQLAPPEPAQFTQWLLSAAAALALGLLAKKFIRRPPLEAEFLSKREFADFKDKDFAALCRRLDESFQSLSNKLDAINNRLHEVRSLVDRLDERSRHRLRFPSSVPSVPSVLKKMPTENP